MKTDFQLEDKDNKMAGEILIIGESPNDSPYVYIELLSGRRVAWIKDKDLERFAVNILKALKSKKLK